MRGIGSSFQNLTALETTAKTPNAVCYTPEFNFTSYPVFVTCADHHGSGISVAFTIVPASSFAPGYFTLALVTWAGPSITDSLHSLNTQINVKRVEAETLASTITSAAFLLRGATNGKILPQTQVISNSGSYVMLAQNTNVDASHFLRSDGVNATIPVSTADSASIKSLIHDSNLVQLPNYLLKVNPAFTGTLTGPMATLNQAEIVPASGNGIFRVWRGSGRDYGGGITANTSDGDVYIESMGDNSNPFMRFRMRVNGTPVDAMDISGAGNVTANYGFTVAGQFTSTNDGGGSASGVFISSASGPSMGWRATGAAANNRVWDMNTGGTTMSLRAVNDANSAAGTALSITRSGTTITEIDLNAPTYITGMGYLNGDSVATKIYARSVATGGGVSKTFVTDSLFTSSIACGLCTNPSNGTVAGWLAGDGGALGQQWDKTYGNTIATAEVGGSGLGYLPVGVEDSIIIDTITDFLTYHYLELHNGSAGQAVVLPDPRDVPNGWSITIVDYDAIVGTATVYSKQNHSGAVTFFPSGGATETMPTTLAAVLTCYSKTFTAGLKPNGDPEWTITATGISQ